MAITDREMFRQTSYRSPNVTVIGESGGGVRPEVNIPPPTTEIDIGGFDQPEFEVNPIMDNIPTETPNLITDSGLGENQIRLSTGEIITVDPSSLSNIVNSDDLFSLDVYGMLNSPDVLLGSNVERIVSQALENRGGSAGLFRNPIVPYRMAKDVFAEGGEELMNYYRKIFDLAKKTPEILSIFSPEEAVKLRETIKKGEVEPFEKIDDLYVSPIGDEKKSLKDAILSGYRSRESLDDLYRGAQLQSEINSLDVPSQTQMESDVAEELPTEEIAANTIETQEDPTIVADDIDTQADLERRIKEGQSQMAISKIDRESLTEKEKEERIREDIDETEFEVSKEQQDKFFADEQKYIKDLAIAETFGGQKFKDYLGSIGKQLVRTGSFMGIPLGTADFVESEEGKRAAEAEAEIELTKEQIKQTGKDTGPSVKDLKTIKDASTEFNQHSGDFQGARAAVVLIDEVLALVDQAKQAGGAQLGGLLGYYDLAKDSLLAALNIPNEPSAATTVANTLKVLQNRNIREILGESGRTISNVDRDIVKGVFGEFTLTTNIETVEKKLKESRNALITNMNKYKANMQSTFDFLQESGEYGKRQALAGSDVMMDAIRFDPSVRQSNQGKLKGESLLDKLNKVTEIDL
mgnify:FL=1